MSFPQKPTNPVPLEVERKINECKTLAEYNKVKADHHSNFIGSLYLTTVGDEMEKWLNKKKHTRLLVDDDQYYPDSVVQTIAT